MQIVLCLKLNGLTAVTYGLLLCILVDKRETKHTIFYLFVYDHELSVVCNGNRTEWSPIQSAIIQVITKLVECVGGVRFVYHRYRYFFVL